MSVPVLCQDFPLGHNPSHTMSATQLVFDFVFKQSQKMFKSVNKMDPTHHSTLARETKAVEMMQMARDLAVYIDDEMPELVSESDDDYEDEEETDEEMSDAESIEENGPQDAEMAESDNEDDEMDTAVSGRSPVPAPLPDGSQITGASPHTAGVPDRSRLEGGGC